MTIGFAVECTRKQVAACKQWLQSRDYLDLEFALWKSPAHDCVRLPLRSDLDSNMDWAKELPVGKVIPLEPQFHFESSPYRKASRSPREKILDRLVEHCVEHLDATPRKELYDSLDRWFPRKWELYQDFLLFPEDASFENPFGLGTEQIYATISTILHPNAPDRLRIARKSRIPPEDPLRRPKIQWLISSLRGKADHDGNKEPFWTRVSQNGIMYYWQPERTMFCQGNISEKLRVAEFRCHNETVLDLYAGIGYFTLPLLLKAGARRVLACEWNEYSVQGLERSLRHHQIPFVTLSEPEPIQMDDSVRCWIFRGDNRTYSAQVRRRADRVHLGLLPDAQQGFPMAILALKSSGGFLHVHENVPEGEEAQWSKELVEIFEQLLLEDRPEESWTVECLHVEHVKSFAPRIHHLVADIQCRPKSHCPCAAEGVAE